jgi:hypothetical protein
VHSSSDQVAQWRRIEALYGQGLPIREIADEECVDRKTVYNVARRAGLPPRRQLDRKRAKRILEAYRAGTRVTDIAEREGVRREYVRFVARRGGLPPQPSARRRYPLDESAFSHLDGVGWWLIGLLAADGSVGRRSNLISLTQSARDADVLHAFLAYVGCPDRPLTELRLSSAAAARAWPRRRAFEARVFSKRLQTQLARHGIVPGKSRSLRLSDEAAAKPAVWLGLLDGDGWVSATGQRGRPLIDFCGAPPVMEQCSRFWGGRLRFQRSLRPQVRTHRRGLRRVAIHGANATEAAQILLASSPISMRRKRRILEAIASIEP